MFRAAAPGVEPVPSSAKAPTLRLEADGSASAPSVALLPQAILFDTLRLRPDSVPKIVESLSAIAADLTALGPVDVLTVGSGPHHFGEPSADAKALRDALASVPRQVKGTDHITRMRSEYMAGSERDRGIRAREFFNEELSLGRDLLDAVATTVTRRGPGGILYLVTDGFDERPEDFYQGSSEDRREPSAPEGRGAADLGRQPKTSGEPAAADGSASRARREGFGSLPAKRKEIAMLLASRGWVMVPILPQGAIDRGWTGAAEFPQRERATAVFPASGPSALSPGPSLALGAVAEDTGGFVVNGFDDVARTRSRFGTLVLVTYELDRIPDGRVHRLTARGARPEVKVQATSWISVGTPEEVAGRDAIERLAGGAVADDLRVEVRVGPSTASTTKGSRPRTKVVADVRWGELAEVLKANGGARVRVTLAIDAAGKEPFVKHQEFPLGMPDLDRVFRYESELEVAGDVRRLVVRIEELATGATGAGSVSLERSAAP